MARVYLALFLLGLVFAVLALISCLSAEDGQVRALPRLLWVVLILVFPLLGSLAYYFAGRPLRPAPASGTSGWGGVGGGRHRGWAAGETRPRPMAPDDDPEFLRRIDPRNRNGGEPGATDERP